MCPAFTKGEGESSKIEKFHEDNVSIIYFSGYGGR